MNQITLSLPTLHHSCDTFGCCDFFEWIADLIYQTALSIHTFVWSLICGVEESVYDDEVINAIYRLSTGEVRGQVNGVYILTNETNLEASYQTLSTHPAPNAPSTIHIGCASWFNLDVICARQSTYGLILDFNPKNAEFMQKTAEFIRQSNSREELVERVIDHLNSLWGSERRTFFHWDQRGSLQERIRGELTRPGSWLSCDASFRYIKEELVEKDRLLAITEDFTNTTFSANLCQLLATRTIAIDTLYLSNVCNFMRTDRQREAFSHSVRNLTAPDTLLINCPLRVENGETIRLRQTAGTEQHYLF